MLSDAFFATKHSILFSSDATARGDTIFVNRTGVTDIKGGLLDKFRPEELLGYEAYHKETIARGPWLEEWLASYFEETD